jgi:release factor glutamine methyltransferase
MSVAELIEGAAGRLRAAGVIKPRREVHRLWAWLNRVSPGEAFFTRERSVAPPLLAAFEAAVARRVSGEPMAYVLGHTGFRNLQLRCDRRALIPRPESEGVIDLALHRVRSGKALDLGTGTGCLGLALADEGSFDEVIAVDCSSAALELAAENAALTGNPLRLVGSDFGAALAGERFDLLVANPPYLTAAEYAGLDPSVRAWEPELALVGGPDGLVATRQVLRDGTGALRSGGWLVMELDSTRAPAVAELARAAGYAEVGLWDDLFGRPRYLTARLILTPES